MSKLFPAKAALLAVVASVMAAFALAPAAFGAACADCEPGGGGGGGTPNVVPTAAFGWGPTVPNVGTTVQFSNSSSDSDGSIASYSWTFGDGRTSTAATPSISYSTPGTYQVTLTVTDNDGASSQPVSHNVRVNRPPSGGFLSKIESAETGHSVAFNGWATDSDGWTSAMVYDFGDGSSQAAISTFHVYSHAGVYDVTLTITDNEGGVSHDHYQITISDPAPDPDPDPNPDPNPDPDPNPNPNPNPDNGGNNGGSTTTHEPAPQPVVAAVEQPAPAPVEQQAGPVKDSAAPVLVVPASVKAKKKAGKLAYTVTTDEAVTVVATLKGKVKGGATIRIAKAGSGKVVIKLSTKARKALRAAKSVKLTLVTTATDASGNKTTKTTKVTLV